MRVCRDCFAAVVVAFAVEKWLVAVVAGLNLPAAVTAVDYDAQAAVVGPVMPPPLRSSCYCC